MDTHVIVLSLMACVYHSISCLRYIMLNVNDLDMTSIVIVENIVQPGCKYIPV